ncbi:MAG: hypothetical protein AB6733_14920 [Clostridiaceae bacterium]
MGAWSIKLYGSDIACDIKGEYIDKLKRGMKNEEITELLINDNQDLIEEEEDGAEFWFALADTQWNYGRLLPHVKEMALQYLERDEHLERWRECGKKRLEQRIKVLEELKEKLQAPMPPEKRVLGYRLYKCPWKIGDIFAYRLNTDYSKEKGFDGKYIVFRKVGESTSWPGHIVPVIHVYKWIGDEIPSINLINRLSLLPQTFSPTFYKNLKGDPIRYKLTLTIENKKSVERGNFFYLGNMENIDNPKMQKNERDDEKGIMLKYFDEFVIKAYLRWEDIDFNNL